MNAGPERRGERRHAVEGRAAWIQAGDRGASAALVDISRSGALLLSPIGFPAYVPVCLHAEGPTPRARVEGVVVEATEGGAGHRIRVAFRGRCPEAVFRALAGGGLADEGPPAGRRNPYTEGGLLPLEAASLPGRGAAR